MYTSEEESTTIQRHDLDDDADGLILNINLSSLKFNDPCKSGILYEKESQPPTGSKEEVDLIKLIIEKQGEPFKEITTACKDPDSLQHNFTLSQRLRHMEEAWRNVDMLAPYNILFPTKE